MPSATDAPARPLRRASMIEVERLTIGYGERVVLERLDFTIRAVRCSRSSAAAAAASRRCSAT
jgi:hypothetical protein